MALKPFALILCLPVAEHPSQTPTIVEITQFLHIIGSLEYHLLPQFSTEI
jgi:hypothetical protein